MQVKLNHIKNLNFKASVRDFKNINLDEPKSFHGTDLGPSAVEYLLIGIGGCLGSSFVYCLIKHKIELEDLEILVDGNITHKLPAMRLKLKNVNVKLLYTLKETSQKSDFEDCLRIFKDHCVVSESLMNGIPINIECEKK